MGSDSLRAALARCNSEIEDRLRSLRDGDIDGDPIGGGILLGLHDWSAERILIMAEIESQKEVKFSGGATSSPCPRYELIPLAADTALALRFERGVRLRGAGAWNALSKNQSDADNADFVINRLAHAAKHIKKAIAILSGNALVIDEESVEDGGDAGAILFAGALLAEHEARKKLK